jgi:hypothetical protein
MSEAKRNYYLSCDKDLPSILPDNKLVNHVNSASNYIKELEEQNKRLIELIEYCCYDEDFDADSVIIATEKITGKTIEEVFKDE